MCRFKIFLKLNIDFLSTSEIVKLFIWFRFFLRSNRIFAFMRLACLSQSFANLHANSGLDHREKA